MAWQDNLRLPLRVYINDINEETYTDDTLDKVMVTAASYVIQEVRLQIPYVVDFTTYTLSPDPSTDSIFINFIVLKSACLINGWNFNSRAIADGIFAICGPVHVRSDSPGSNIIMALLKEGPCKLYNDLKNENNMGGGTNPNVNTNIKAILSPFTHEDSSLFPHMYDRR
jgi:hypothetical protein